MSLLDTQAQRECRRQRREVRDLLGFEGEQFRLPFSFVSETAAFFGGKAEEFQLTE